MLTTCYYKPFEVNELKITKYRHFSPEDFRPRPLPLFPPPAHFCRPRHSPHNLETWHRCDACNTRSSLPPPTQRSVFLVPRSSWFFTKQYRVLVLESTNTLQRGGSQMLQPCYKATLYNNLQMIYFKYCHYGTPIVASLLNTPLLLTWHFVSSSPILLVSTWNCFMPETELI